MEKKIDKKHCTLKSDKCVLQYLSPNTVILDLSFILTCGKRLNIGTPYMLIEGHHTEAIRLIEVRNDSNQVYLKIEHLKTKKLLLFYSHQN